MTSRQIKQNAQAVAEGLTSDWRNAYVIACSVALVEHGGARRGSSASSHLKVSAKEFAALVKAAANGKVYGMGEAAVRAALRKWDRVAAASGLPTSDTLAPEDANEDVTYPDRSWYEDDGSEHTVKSKADDIKANVATIGQAMANDPTFAAAIVAAQPEAVGEAVTLNTTARRIVEDEYRDRVAAVGNALGRAEANRKQGSGWWRYSGVGKHIHRARNELRQALKDAEGATFDGELLEFLMDDVQQVKDALALVELRFTDPEKVDWDAALKTLDNLS